MRPGTDAKNSKERVLFPGTSSYPLSPFTDENQRAMVEQTDQIRIIFKKLGLQDTNDLSFISTEEGLDFIKKINSGDKLKPKRHFLMNSFDEDLKSVTDLIEQML